MNDDCLAAWKLELTPWKFWCQTADWTADGQPDENRLSNCGPEATAMCVWHITNIELPADYIHDVEKGQGYVGYTSVEDQVGFLQNLCGIPVDVLSFDASQQWGMPEPYRLLRAIRQALDSQHPLIELFSFSAPNAPDGHFRAVYAMEGTGDPGQPGSSGHVWTADPATGQPRVETWREHWSWSKGVLLHLKRRRCVA